MYERSLIFLLSFFVLISCQKKIVDSSFFYETNRRWIAASKVVWVSEHYKQDSQILEPKGTWQPILEVSFLDLNFNQVSDCLFYKVPHLGSDGVLKVISNPSGATCINIIGEEEYTEMNGIINFGYEYDPSLNTKNNLTLKIDTLRFKYNFLNMNNSKTGTSLLSSSVGISKILGAKITSDISYNIQSIKHKNGKICFDVNNACEVVIPNTCDQCLFGSFKTVSSSCVTQHRRVCGVDMCGRKGFPACLRGFLASRIDLDKYCINDSPVGICQKGLRVICENNTLMCE